MLGRPRRREGGWVILRRIDRGDGSVTGNVSLCTFFFSFRQTQDVDHDESQVSEKDKEHKTEVVQQSTTCRFLLP